jgi:tRNA dimethylallyltransferase
MQYPVAKPLLVIVGPTAVGKTKIAIEIAKILEGEIISADSRCFYRGMDIGTAKPSLQERAIIPHFMIDIVDPDEIVSLAIFQKMVLGIIDNIHQRYHLPVLVGGTGQYIHAIIKDWNIPAQEPDIKLRNILEEWAGEIGHLELYKKLSLIDPEAAISIDPRNLRRTIRALEVNLKTGQKFSSQRKSGVPPFKIKMVGLMLPRQQLFAIIDRRIEQMIKAEWVEEVKGLIQRFSADLPAFSAIGYHEIIQFLHGEISLEEASILMKRKTRQFVRRQSNWFKTNDPHIRWFDVQSASVQEICDFVLSRDNWFTSYQVRK